MTSLVYRPEAAADVEHAHDWYERQRTGLGEEFLTALRRAERAIEKSPSAYRVVRRDTRRVLMRRFPYQPLYQIIGASVVVVACFHGRRSPRTLAGRR